MLDESITQTPSRAAEACPKSDKGLSPLRVGMSEIGQGIVRCAWACPKSDKLFRSRTACSPELGVIAETW